MWTYTGKTRPAFADPPREGQSSVWDFPRPPALVPDARRVIVAVGDVVIAQTVRAVRVMETASPPTFYLPTDDVDLSVLVPARGGSMCEWKGMAAYWSVALAGRPVLEAVGWSYPQPKAAFAGIAGWLSFYPGRLRCEIDGERVRAQPGGFYGGWMTDDIAGPVKGDPGTGHW